jgi:nucleotide-binding universal stress UspA family protein
MAFRTLIAVHGFEPRGWARALPVPDADLVGVLVVGDVPRSAFTSLLPAARRRHRAALAEWRRQEEARTRETVEALQARLPARADVARLDAGRGEIGRTVAEYARAWHADVMVVGRDTRPAPWRALLGTVHEDVVQHAPCAVLVTPVHPPAPTRIPIAMRATLPGGV